MLKKKYDECIERLGVITEYPWHEPAFYAAWLTQSYYYSRQVTRILLMASAHSPLENNLMHKRFDVHAGEERGHEALAERDVKDLGFDVKKIGEFPVTTGFYSTQYHIIQHISPEALFGWILPLEGIAIHYGKAVAEKAAKKPGTPSRFFNVHVDEDPDHVESAFSVVKNFPPEAQEQVVRNMEFTVDMYIRILDCCREFSAQQKGRKAS